MSFGSFQSICSKTGFPLCSVIAPLSQEHTFVTEGIVPQCYARPFESANTMIFQVGNAFIHIGALMIILIIIFNVWSKYMAIGRREMLSFFYYYMALEILSLVVDCGVCPPGSATYGYFVALQLGTVGAVCLCLLYNGLLSFELWEDGLLRSMLVMHSICGAWFVVNFVVSLLTFKSWGGMHNSNTTAVFVVTYIGNAVILAFYIVSQVVLSFFTGNTYWNLGALFLLSFFFVAGQILIYVFNQTICERLSHYVDALFFASLGNLFAVMMVYKYWDMITPEDFEFSVAPVAPFQNQPMFDDKKSPFDTSSPR